MKINQVNPLISKPYFGRNSQNKSVKPSVDETPKMQLASLPLTSQYLAFKAGASINLEQTLMVLDSVQENGEDVYPPGVRELAQKFLAEGNSEATLIDVHRAHYAGLLDCKTLEEVRDRFPEFEDVCSTDSVDSRSGLLKDYLEGELKGFSPNDDLALKVLQLYWGAGFSFREMKTFSGGKDFYSLMGKNALNIPKKHPIYAQYLRFSDKEYNEDLFKRIAKNRAETINSPEWRALNKLGGNSGARAPMSAEQRAKISESLKRFYLEHPEEIYRLSAAAKAFYEANPEELVKLQRVTTLAWYSYSATGLVKTLSDYLKKKSPSEAADINYLDAPQEATKKQTQLMSQFWKDHPEASKELSKLMEEAWKKVNKEIAKNVTYTVPVFPTSYCENLNGYYKQRNQSIGRLNLYDGYETYNPNTGGVVPPKMLTNAAYMILGPQHQANIDRGYEVVCDDILKEMYQEALNLNASGTSDAELLTNKKLYADLAKYIKQDKSDKKISARTAFNEIYKRALFESRVSRANKMQKRFEEVSVELARGVDIARAAGRRTASPELLLQMGRETGKKKGGR